MRKDKVIGICGLNPRVGGCGGKITKAMLSIYDDKIKKEVGEIWADDDGVVGICKCEDGILLEEITDKDIRLLLEI